MPKTILITGGAGYIGSHVAKHFLEKGNTVIIVDDLSGGFQGAIEALQDFGDVQFKQGDIAEADFVASVFSQYSIDAVCHLAALCVPHESFEKTAEYERVNVLGTKTILEAMAKAGVRFLTFASTCSVYGDVDSDTALTINQLVNPPHPYAETKFRAEEEIRKHTEIKSVIFRFFNVCGADEEGRIGDGRRPSHLLMANAVSGALGLNPFYFTCPHVDTPDGTPIRDYINVLDLARAHDQAIAYLENGGESVLINLGSGQGNSVKQIVDEVERVLGVTFDKKQAPARAGEPKALFADITAARDILNWQPEKSLEDSIRSLAKWYTRHPNGYNS